MDDPNGLFRVQYTLNFIDTHLVISITLETLNNVLPPTGLYMRSRNYWQRKALRIVGPCFVIWGGPNINACILKSLIMPLIPFSPSIMTLKSTSGWRRTMLENRVAFWLRLATERRTLSMSFNVTPFSSSKCRNEQQQQNPLNHCRAASEYFQHNPFCFSFQLADSSIFALRLRTPHSLRGCQRGNQSTLFINRLLLLK